MIPMLRDKQFLPGFDDDFFGKAFLSNFIGNDERSIPNVNVSETENDYRIEVAAPGLEKKDFNVDIEKNILTISSQQENQQTDDDKNYIRREFNYFAFKRSFSLPEHVEQDKISASHKNGILEVVIPKREEAREKPKRQIKIG